MCKDRLPGFAAMAKRKKTQLVAGFVIMGFNDRFRKLDRQERI